MGSIKKTLNRVALFLLVLFVIILNGEDLNWTGNKPVRFCWDGEGDIKIESEGNKIELIDWEVRYKAYDSLEVDNLDFRYYWKIRITPPNDEEYSVDISTSDGNISVCPSDQFARATDTPLDWVQGGLFIGGILSGILWLWVWLFIFRQ
jgi:hypothetical protein